MKPIDADAMVTVELYDDEHEEYYTERMTIAECLDRYTEEGCPLESADRPQGKWKAKSFHECFCDNCGFSFDMMKCEFLENMKYCPNCGVRKGADDEQADR